jgi:hypothetical protein
MNPNCYQAFIIQYIIEDKKSEAIKCCDELLTAFKYYKWDSKGKESDYIDHLICDSSLLNWQKSAIIHIISNNAESCKSIIENEIKDEIAHFNKCKADYTNSFRSLLNDVYGVF